MIPLERPTCRNVGGQLVRQVVEDSSSARFEVLRRRTTGTLDWQFNQPTLALFWFNSGFKSARLTIDGDEVNATITPSKNLGIVAARATIEGEFQTDNYCDYAVAFLDVGSIDGNLHLDQSVMTFGSPYVTAGFAELCRMAGKRDMLSKLMLEGWSLQTVARLSIMAEFAGRDDRNIGHLPAASLRRVSEFVNEFHASAISVADMAEVAGYSPRHFARAFRKSTTRTPMQYVTQTRVETAKRLIVEGGRSMTVVAASCGFSHSQHFSVTFKRVTGVSPMEFARAQSS